MTKFGRGPVALLHVSSDRSRFKETCSNSKCYSDLRASEKTHGAAGGKKCPVKASNASFEAHIQ
ncbi:hypothetical protein EPK84_08385 (plasmid) [Sinorhizobium fredii]|nr:hypothetical protein EPK84_08385 [Sinorhizobium fredii]